MIADQASLDTLLPDTVPRLEAPDADVFWEQFVVKQQPAIFSGLFQDQQIAALRSREAVRARLGEMRLQFKGEYVEHFLDQVHGRAGDPRLGETLSFAEYCDHVDRHPETAGWMGQEQVPEQLMALFEVPPHCRAAHGGPDNQLLIHTFIGHPGKSASLHIDTDYKQVLIYELYGRKRVYLIPSSACLPLRTAGFISRLDLSRLSERERVETVTALGGWCATLHPGECLFLPFSLYHHFAYLDDAMSINIRFGRNRYHDLFNRYMVPHWSLHALAARLTDEARVEGEERALFTKVLRCLERPAASAYARYQRIVENLVQLCHEHGAVRAYPELEQQLAHAYYQVPEAATEYVPRFRIDFQKCYWHRGGVDLSGWEQSPAEGKRLAKAAEVARDQAPCFASPGRISLFAISVPLDVVDEALLDPNSGPLALWLRADFDLFLSEEMRVAVTLAPDRCRAPLSTLLAALGLDPQWTAASPPPAMAALVAVANCDYDGRYSGSETMTFLGTYALTG